MTAGGGPPRERIVRCPGCGEDTVYSTANPYRPFCSERCKSGDFGAWASERYRVGAPPEEPPSDEPLPH
jgi:endogenous inhibitor of DNA gyrase (YacG/DUF329 family)